MTGFLPFNIRLSVWPSPLLHNLFRIVTCPAVDRWLCYGGQANSPDLSTNWSRPMFEFNEPYEESDPQAIRSDFAELSLIHFDSSPALLHKLACYLPTDTLRDFMNDLAMDRV